MSWLLTLIVITFSGVVAVLAAATAAAPALAPLEPIVRVGAKVVQAAGVLVAALAGLALLRGHEPNEVWISAGYAIAVVGVPFLLLTRQPDEEGRPVDPPNLWVIAIAAVTMAVLVLRLQQTW